MPGKYFNTPVVKAKVATLVLGVAVLTLGLFSHFQSRWTRFMVAFVGTPVVVRMYQICDIKYFFGLPEDYPSCPSIGLEHFYVFMIITCFVLSLVGLIAGLVTDLKSAPMKYVDQSFHVISSVMLVVAGALFIFSAIQISRYVFGPDGEPEEAEENDLFKLRKWEKVAAGALTIIHGFVYGVVALLINKF